MSEGFRPPSSRDVAGEDFLFHLYRGSELLQDDRVHDAKAELEQALSLQPSDPKGQDLLAIVYFRLGMYPRAITIYERLIQTHTEAITPRINLALCYLKTGQPAQARIELERVIEHDPGHSRAWGYLGLAFQRMGDYERAHHAFAAGGHDAMARRLLEMSGAGASQSLRPEPMAPEKAEIRRAAGEAFQELDRAGGGFRPDADLSAARPLGDAAAPQGASGTWAAVEPGREPIPAPPLMPASLGTRSITQAGFPAVTAPIGDPLPAPRPFDAGPPSAARPPGALPAPAITALARELLLVFPRDASVALHPSGVVLAQSTSSFATRLEVVRSMALNTGWTTAALSRRVRGKAIDEPLGGPSSPIYEVTGKGELVLGPPLGRHLRPVLADDGEPLYLREDVVSAFEIAVGYENGRLAVGDGEAISMLQLRGKGVIVASLPERVSAIEITPDRSAALRALAVLGWVGRIVPRALLPSEAPAGVRGFVSFAGEGMVLIDAR